MGILRAIRRRKDDQVHPAQPQGFIALERDVDGRLYQTELLDDVAAFAPLQPWLPTPGMP